MFVKLVEKQEEEIHVIYKNPIPNVSLSQEEIKELREIYLVNDDAPPLIEVKQASLEEYIDRCDCYVVAEVSIIRNVWDSLEQDSIVITYN